MKSRGFTIVELLIVIVVIGILAAIVIVAYNGVQQRANNQRRVVAAKEWQKTITAYVSVNGKYPVALGAAHACLGVGNPTDLDTNLSDEDCFGSGNSKHPITAVNDAFKTATGSLPTFPTEKIVTGTAIGTVVGISIRHEALDPAGVNRANYPMIHYWLYGTSQDCVLKPVLVPVTGGYNYSSSQNFSYNEGPATHCVIAAADPNG